MEVSRQGGLPSVPRVAVCVAASSGAASVGFTVAFVISAPGDGTSLLEYGGIILALLVFYAPASLWAAGSLSVATVVAAGLVVAHLTHRYRLSVARQGAHVAVRIGLAVLITYSAWVLIVGLVFVVVLLPGR
jgi:hypothetical protein